MNINDTLNPRAVAYFIGYQLTLRGERVALFNLLVSLPLEGSTTLTHPVESTVSEMTLRAHGYHVPCNPLLGERVNSTLRVSHNKSCT